MLWANDLFVCTVIKWVSTSFLMLSATSIQSEWCEPVLVTSHYISATFIQSVLNYEYDTPHKSINQCLFNGQNQIKFYTVFSIDCVIIMHPTFDSWPYAQDLYGDRRCVHHINHCRTQSNTRQSNSIHGLRDIFCTHRAQVIFACSICDVNYTRG